MQPELRYSRDEDGAEPGDAPQAPPSPFHAFAQNIGARRLMIAIVAMPFFFILLLVAIIAVVGLPEDEAADQAAESAPAVETATPDVAAAPVERAETAPPSPALAPLSGAAPGAMALDGDRLAVRVERPDGAVIVIYDLSQGAVTHEIPLETLGAER